MVGEAGASQHPDSAIAIACCCCCCCLLLLLLLPAAAAAVGICPLMCVPPDWQPHHQAVDAEQGQQVDQGTQADAGKPQGNSKVYVRSGIGVCVEWLAQESGICSGIKGRGCTSLVLASLVQGTTAHAGKPERNPGAAQLAGQACKLESCWCQPTVLTPKLMLTKSEGGHGVMCVIDPPAELVSLLP
jgi:hypothetical protein